MKFINLYNKYIIYIIATLIVIALGLDLFITKDIEFDLLKADEIMLTAISILFTILFSYFIFLKQRYDYTDKVFNNQDIIIAQIMILLFLGVVVIIFNKIFFILEILFIFLSLIEFSKYTIILYNDIKKNKLTNIINSYVANIKQEISKDDKLSKKEIFNNEAEILKIYNKEYLNYNIDLCIYIINKVFDFLIEDVITKNSRAIKGKKDTSFIDLIFDMFGKMLKNDKSHFAIQINNQILDKIKEYLIVLIKCDITKNLDSLMGKYFNILYDFSEYINVNNAIKNLYLLTEQVYRLKDFSLFKKIDKLNLKVLNSLSLESNTNNYGKFVIKYYTSIFKNIIEKKDDYYKFIFNQYKHCILRNSFSFETNSIIESIEIIFTTEYYKLDNEVKEDINDLLMSLIKTTDYKINISFLNFINNYITQDYVIEKGIKEDIKISCIDKMIGFTKSIPLHLYPSLYIKVVDDITELKLKENIEKIKLLIKKAITKENNVVIGELFMLLEKTIDMYSISDRKELSQWLNVYKDLIITQVLRKNDKFLSSLIFYFSDCIITLTKNGKIDSTLGRTLIEIISDLLISCIDEYEEAAIKLLYLFDDLLGDDKKNTFIYGYNGIEKDVYRLINEAYVSAVEYKKDKIIRKISNFLGWKIKEKIQNDDPIAEVILLYNLNVYELGYINRLSDDTLVFIGTLFIIIGALCETDKKYNKYKTLLKNKIGQNKYKQLLLRSMKMRDALSYTWDDILDSNASKYFNNFYNYLYNDRK